MSSKKTLDADVIAAAIQDSEGRDLPFRDIRNLIPLSILEEMTPADVEYVFCTMNGMSKPQIRSRLGCKHNRVAEIGHSDIVKKAIIEAKRNLAQGLITSADVAAAAESELLSMSSKLARDDTVDLDMRFKYTKLVLDYRIAVMKAMPILSKDMENDIRRTEVRIESEAKEKIVNYMNHAMVVDVDQIHGSKVAAEEEEDHAGENASMTLPENDTH